MSVIYYNQFIIPNLFHQIYYIIFIIRDVDDVHNLMDDVAEQQEIANEISEAISNPVGFGNDVDEVTYKFIIIKLYFLFYYKFMDYSQLSRVCFKDCYFNGLFIILLMQHLFPFSKG